MELTPSDNSLKTFQMAALTILVTSQIYKNYQGLAGKTIAACADTSTPDEDSATEEDNLINKGFEIIQYRINSASVRPSDLLLAFAQLFKPHLTGSIC